MPQAAEDLWRRLGGEGTCADHDLWRRAREDRWGLLGDGRATTRGEALFPRIDKKAYFKEETMNTTSSTPGTPGTPGGPPGAEGSATPAPPAAASDQITIQDFLKVKLRTAVIRDAVKVEGADKLLKLTVDLGGETRTIVAGIALQYEPASLVGKSVVVVANLKPAKLRGVESQGMLLAADIGGKPIIATFEQEVPPGSTVR
jgi:methionyl-tRNA synthetase